MATATATAASTARGDIFEIEVDGPRNENLVFSPLDGHRVRGRWDYNRVAEPKARMASAEWPEAIPGQRIRLNRQTETGELVETLHDPEFAVTKRLVTERGFSIAEPTKEYSAVHVPSWQHVMREAVKAGVARVTAGEVPEELDGKPKADWPLSHPEPTETTLANALTAMAKAIAAQTEAANVNAKATAALLAKLESR